MFPGDSDASMSEGRNYSFKREIVVRLFLVYAGLVIFLLSIMIGEFYEAISDVVNDVSQGSTGYLRNWTSIDFLSPFNAGWVGGLPWYGMIPYPPWEVSLYHDSWAWTYSTAFFADNPGFFRSHALDMWILAIIFAVVFLAPLLFKSIRKSFIPSIFYLMTAMAIITRPFFGCFAQAWVLASGGSIKYGISIVTAESFPLIYEMLLFCSPIIVGLFVLFIVLARRLWRVHYNDTRSLNRFLTYVASSYWIGLIITILMV